MAHTIRRDESFSRFYTITFDPALHWNSEGVFPGGMEIVAIEMAPNAANDAVVVRDGSAEGARIFSHEAIDTYDIAVRYYGRHTKFGFKGVHCYPYIASGEATGTFDITFELA